MAVCHLDWSRRRNGETYSKWIPPLDSNLRLYSDLNDRALRGLLREDRLLGFLLGAMLASQTRLASDVRAPLAAEAVFAFVLAALLIGFGYVYLARDSS